MDHNFTKKVQDWLNAPADKRNLEQGALYLLQLSGNQILYRNIIGNLSRHAEDIEYQLRKYLKFRLQDLTHTQVAQMQQQVDAIVKRENVPTTTRCPMISRHATARTFLCCRKCAPFMQSWQFYLLPTLHARTASVIPSSRNSLSSTSATMLTGKPTIASGNETRNSNRRLLEAACN